MMVYPGRQRRQKFPSPSTLNVLSAGTKSWDCRLKSKDTFHHNASWNKKAKHTISNWWFLVLDKSSETENNRLWKVVYWYQCSCYASVDCVKCLISCVPESCSKFEFWKRIIERDRVNVNKPFNSMSGGSFLIAPLRYIYGFRILSCYGCFTTL